MARQLSMFDSRQRLRPIFAVRAEYLEDREGKRIVLEHAGATWQRWVGGEDPEDALIDAMEEHGLLCKLELETVSAEWGTSYLIPMVRRPQQGRWAPGSFWRPKGER